MILPLETDILQREDYFKQGKWIIAVTIEALL